MRVVVKILLALSLPLFFMACNKEEVIPFDHPFVHTHVNNQDTVYIQSNRVETVDYNIYLSAKRQFEPVEVTYTVIPGNGLALNVDYKVLTPNTTLAFAPGVMQMPVKIQWLSHELDPTKDNSLKIRIESNSKNYTIGLPGPDGLQKQLVIIKRN